MKIAVVFTGGTIGSSVSDGYISTDDEKKYALLEGYDRGLFEIFEPYTILSENLAAQNLNTLIKLANNLKGCDGIIITHGTDTLAYGAAAVSYSLGQSAVPVVFVSANYVLDDERSNGHINFRCALDFIKNGYGKGTFVSYRNRGEAPKIHRATRIFAAGEYSDSVYSAGGEYGHYEDGRFIKNPDFYEFDDETMPFGIVDLTRKTVAKVSPYPGMLLLIPEDAKEVLLTTYHSGTFPEKEIAMINADIYLTGSEDRVQYESVRMFEKKKICVLRKAASSAMYMKLWFSVCSGRQEDMNKALAGDFCE